ncbi:MAG: cupin domain-containing protein [Candidatus Heimdallarchaeaceae archaeon]
MIKKKYTDVKEEEITTYGSTGTTIRWLLTRENDGAPRFAMRRFEIKPGGQIGMHHHEQEHEIYILSGKGIVYTQGQEVEVAADDVLYVPPNEPHGYSNEGEEPLVFICVIPYLE